MALVVKNLLRHPSGRFSYRKIYPDYLRPFAPGGGTAFKRSIGFQTDAGFLQRYEAAASECASILAKAERVKAGAFDALDAPTIAYLSEAFRAEQIEADEQARWDQGEKDTYRGAVAQLQAAGVAFRSPSLGQEGRRWATKARETLEACLPEYRRLRAEGDLDGIEREWRDEALDLAEARGFTIDVNATEPIRQLCRALNDAAISAGEIRLRRLDGEEISSPVEPERTRASASPATASRVPLLSTYEAYAASVGMTPRIRKEGQSHIAKLVSFLGHDDAARVTSKDVGAWRDHLLAEPAQRGGKRSPVTVNDKYLGTLKAMLGWASARGRELLPDNVAQGIRADVPKRRKVRERHFTAEEARKILAASLIPAPPRMSPGNQLARRWVPWLCAYTGARVGEMAQLRGQDVREVDGVWTVRITPDAGTVKDKEYRVVPIHEHLIAQGFLDVVRVAGEGPLFFDPTKQRGDGEVTRHIDKVGERLAKWVREDVGISDEEVMPNHAWRHLFKTMAVDLGILSRVSDAITGHAVPRGEVGRTYEGPFLKTLAAAIGQFPRFEIE